MAVVTIVGKNSNLYKSLKLEEFKDLNEVTEISYNEIDNLTKIENPIIFSYSKQIEDNDFFLRKIIGKSVGKVVLISSIASDVYLVNKAYKYPKIKFYSELIVKETNDFEIIKIGVVKNRLELDNQFYGFIKHTSIDKIEKTISELNFSLESRKIVECWELVDIDKNKLFKLISFIQTIIYDISKKTFYLFRPMLILYRIIGYKNYGYTFIANKINRLC